MLAGSEKVLDKRFDGPGKVLEFFVIKSLGTLSNSQMFDLSVTLILTSRSSKFNLFICCLNDIVSQSLVKCRPLGCKILC